MSDREKALKRARKRYKMDYKGIILNTAVSATSSLTATGLLSALQSIPTGQLPLVVGVLFMAQVLPKLLVELNKSYARNKAKREAFSEGLIQDDFNDSNKRKGLTTLDIFFDLCDHASYF